MSSARPANARLAELARTWDVIVEDVRETQTSAIAFGARRGEHVVIKVVHAPGDEWHSGEVLAALGGERFARVLAHVPGALLMERLQPGTDLTDLVRAGRDDEATEILASIAAQPPVGSTPASATAAERWIASFSRYASTGDRQIAPALIETGTASYTRLCRTQTIRRLLHGDLQHYNVLSGARGWVAIDPKGVVAELAFEAGALLRNPHGCLELLAHEGLVRRRAERFAQCCRVDAHRVLEWGFAQAVLSLVWSREDGHAIHESNPSLVLARTLLPRFA